MSTTALLREIERQEAAAQAELQQDLAEAHNRGETLVKRRRSEWVIDQMRKALPPDHVALANRIMDLQATAEGVAPPGYEAVDCGNARESSMIARCDAMTKLNGFDAAVRSRLGANGSRCFWAIAWGNSLAETIRACEYERGSHGQAKRLVQLVMIAAQEYDDFCRADKARQFSA